MPAPEKSSSVMSGLRIAADLLAEAHHEQCMSAVRDALGMPEASVPEMCERIRSLRQTEVSARYLLLPRPAKQVPPCAG